MEMVPDDAVPMGARLELPAGRRGGGELRGNQWQVLQQ
jgi:hypothetical protein